MDEFGGDQGAPPGQAPVKAKTDEAVTEYARARIELRLLIMRDKALFKLSEVSKRYIPDPI